MKRKVLYIIIPFLFMFFIGLALLLRPNYKVQITRVVDRYTKQQKAAQRTSHKKIVAYAVVEVEFNDEIATVTVHDYMWNPLKEGDQVYVTKNIFGEIVEYNTTGAYRVMACAATMGPLALLMFMFVAKRKIKQKAN